MAAVQSDTGRTCKEAVRALLCVLAFLREQPIPASKAPVKQRQKYVAWAVHWAHRRINASLHLIGAATGPTGTGTFGLT